VSQREAPGAKKQIDSWGVPRNQLDLFYWSGGAGINRRGGGGWREKTLSFRLEENPPPFAGGAGCRRPSCA